MLTLQSCECMYMYMHVSFYLSEPLSDERAQEIIDKALEKSSLQMRNVVAVITGLMGSGKTWLLSRLFNQQPPDLYTSTGITEQSFRGLLHHMMSLSSWEQFSHRNILEFLSLLFREELLPADMVSASIPVPNPAVTDERSLTTLPSTITYSPPMAVVASAPHPIPPSQLKATTTCQSMVRLVKAPKSSQTLNMLELIHMIDTGGQPEVMEHMPSLVYSCHLAVLVLNLMFGPDEYPPIYYHEKGKAYKRKLPSQHTGRQTIQQLACTLQAKRFTQKEDQYFQLLVVATHRDCVKGKLADRVKAYDEALRAILLPACNAELIKYSKKEIPFVLNLKNPDSNDFKKLELIRMKVSESGVGEVINVPGSFFVFEQELIEFAKKKGRDVLSLDECEQVGVDLKMKAEDVQAALIFFHHQITFLYFRHVLPNLVFTNPQVPLDFINAVVQFSYKVNSGELKGVTEKLTSSLRDGIITEEILGHSLLSKFFIPNLYETQHAITLFCHNFTLAPLNYEPQSKVGISEAIRSTTSTSTDREYLMMTLCPVIPRKNICQYVPASSEMVPLLVKFSKDCVPLGCFSSTISCLLTMYNWRLSRSEDNSPECLTHNVVSLYDPQLPVQIILVDATTHIEVHVRVNKGIDKRIFPNICCHTRETVFSAINKVFDIMPLSKIDISPSFICACDKLSESHSASIFQFQSHMFLRCSGTGESVGLAPETHKMWLETPFTEKEKPSLPKLYLLNIPEHVGNEYRKFGTLLLNDVTGTLVDAIEHDCFRQSHHITSTILQKWISRERPTWQVLVHTLRQCQLTLLADKVEKEYL